jgi:hypothetical protein
MSANTPIITPNSTNPSISDLIIAFLELMKAVHSVPVVPVPVVPVPVVPTSVPVVPVVPAPSTLANTESEPESESFASAIVDATGKALAQLLFETYFTESTGGHKITEEGRKPKPKKK